MYVLIAALKVGGLDAAHQRMKKKFNAVPKPEPSANNVASTEPADPDELSERTSGLPHRIEPCGPGFRHAENGQIAGQLLPLATGFNRAGDGSRVREQAGYGVLPAAVLLTNIGVEVVERRVEIGDDRSC